MVHLVWRRAAALALPLLAGCNPAPSRTEALAALRAAHPGLDTTTAFARVWQDGPPWFSCAEVIAKMRSSTDSATVRDQVGNWRPLLVAGWLVLRDTAHGRVADPGWCEARLSDDSTRRVQGWVPLAGPEFPTGEARRGWSVPVGRRRLVVVDAPQAVGRDTARVRYGTTVAVNANGAAMRADLDTAHAVALLQRVGGRWRVAGTSSSSSAAAPDHTR